MMRRGATLVAQGIARQQGQAVEPCLIVAGKQMDGYVGCCYEKGATIC